MKEYFDRLFTYYPTTTALIGVLILSFICHGLVALLSYCHKVGLV